jgi:hypothetical protein
MGERIHIEYNKIIVFFLNMNELELFCVGHMRVLFPVILWFERMMYHVSEVFQKVSVLKSVKYVSIYIMTFVI